MTRVAVAGAGYFAAFHVDAWQRLPGVELCGVADPDEARAGRLATSAGTRAFTDVAQMLERVHPDVLDIVTPPDTHHELALAAASMGVHVIVQKPLAPTWDESVELVAALAAMPVRFMVHENWRWQPWFRALRSMIDDGTTGEPFTATFRLRTGDGWQPDAYVDRQPYFRGYPRLLLYETGVHLFDTFRFLLGPVDRVHASIHRRNGEIAGEDAAIAVLHIAGGRVAVLDASRYNEPESGSGDPRYTLGTMRLDAERGHAILPPDGRLSWQPLGGEPEVVLDRPSTLGFGGDSVRALQAHFLECLRSGAPFESEGDDYLHTVGVVEGCYRSAAAGSVVALDRRHGAAD